MINKVVVGSGHGDVPKYVGKGVVSHGTPNALGVPWPWFSSSTAVFRQFWWAHFGCSASEVHHLIFQRYIVKGHCDIIGHVTAPHMHWSCDLLL